MTIDVLAKDIVLFVIDYCYISIEDKCLAVFLFAFFHVLQHYCFHV